MGGCQEGNGQRISKGGKKKDQGWKSRRDVSGTGRTVTPQGVQKKKCLKSWNNIGSEGMKEMVKGVSKGEWGIAQVRGVLLLYK